MTYPLKGIMNKGFWSEVNFSKSFFLKKFLVIGLKIEIATLSSKAMTEE